jgi:hypothetical protein
MVSKNAFLILTYLGLVHSFPYNNYGIKSLQQENSLIAQALIQKIIVKRDDAQQNGQQSWSPYSSGYSWSSSLPVNSCGTNSVNIFGGCKTPG